LNNGQQILCRDCKWAKDHFKESCYCVHYGYIVSKGKATCRGYKEREQVQESKMGTGREDI